MRELKYLLSKYFVTSYMDDQLSTTIDGTGSELSSMKYNLLVILLESSNPAKIILDRIQDPQPMIISERHIYLLEQLMRISTKY